MERINDTLVRTEHYHVVKSGHGDYAIYNKVLNSPLILDESAYAWFCDHKQITAASFQTADADTKDIITQLVDAYLYLPEGRSEMDYIYENTKVHMEQLSAGRITDCLDLRIAEACNFGCPHCIAVDANHGRIMDRQTAIVIVDKFVTFKQQCDPDFHLLTIHFGNCEPLLNFSVVKAVVEHVAENYPGLQVDYSLNTNLTLLTEEMAVYCRENHIQLYTSLDGPKAGNDKIRIYRDGRGTYDDILKKMELMEKIGTPVKGISVTITDRNYEYLTEKFMTWCVQMQFECVALDFDLTHTSNISNQEKADFLCKTWEFFHRQGVECYGTWMTPFISLSNQSAADKAYAFCKSSEGHNCSVDSLGNVYSCGFACNPMGTMDTLKETLESGGKYYNYVYTHLAGLRTEDRCRGCVLEGACVGQCEMTILSADEVLIESQCDFYRQVTAGMLLKQIELLKEKVTDENC